MLEIIQESFRDFVFGNGNIAVTILALSAVVVLASRILRIGKL